ncbi:MAG: TerB family tellurite resistance protein [Planctomycetes bacterium]|nr:TerB family tellurite resistance protein [Planctomycetota bacterium]
MICLIIYGSKSVESVVQQGRFHCPTCGPDKAFHFKKVQRYFTLYFIPLIALDILGEYVECIRGCGQTFRKDILSYDPQAEQEEAEAEFREVMLQVMIEIMMADGDMDNSELRTVSEIYERVGGKKLSKRRLNKHLERREEEGAQGTIDYLGEVRGYLNEDGKTMVIRAALAVAAADGEFQQEEQDLMRTYARALGLGKRQYRSLIEEMFDA